MCTIEEIKLKDRNQIIMKPVNPKLPWMDPITIPDEYYEDLENKKKP